MCAKRNDEPVEQPNPTGQILEATADIFYLTAEGLESHRCNRMTVEGERCGQPVSPREGKFGTFWSSKNYKNHAK